MLQALLGVVFDEERPPAVERAVAAARILQLGYEVHICQMATGPLRKLCLQRTFLRPHASYSAMFQVVAEEKEAADVERDELANENRGLQADLQDLEFQFNSAKEEVEQLREEQDRNEGAPFNTTFRPALK